MVILLLFTSAINWGYDLILFWQHFSFLYILLLQPENVLVDRKGNIKISDFGLSALPQHLGVRWLRYPVEYFLHKINPMFARITNYVHLNFQKDGLLHTTCGSPNYIAPEVKKVKRKSKLKLVPVGAKFGTKFLQVLQNRGYDGSLSDIWSCGVILYVMLIGYLPFDDRNLVVLYQKVGLFFTITCFKVQIILIMLYCFVGQRFSREICRSPCGFRQLQKIFFVRFLNQTRWRGLTFQGSKNMNGFWRTIFLLFHTMMMKT